MPYFFDGFGLWAAIAYAAVLFVAVATPGPAMLTVISTGVSRGSKPAAAVGLGIAAGDVLLVTAALLGVAAAMQAADWLLLLVQYGGALYLFYIGSRLWRSAGALATPSGAGGDGLRSLLPGLTVALSNPKAILFHASLMPLILDLRRLTWADTALVLATVACVNVMTMGGYALLSGCASQWFQTASRVRLVNRVGGAAMVAAALVIALR